jgi:hypothetical protein
MLSSKPPRAGFDWNRIEIGRGRIAVLGALGWLDHHSKAAPARQELNLRAGAGAAKARFPAALIRGRSGERPMGAGGPFLAIWRACGQLAAADARG